MWTVAAAWAGATAVIWVAPLTVNEAATAPKLTPAVPRKFVPVSTTTVPPSVGPLLVPRALTAGADGADQVNWSALLVEEVPFWVTTVTWAVPAEPAGATTLRAVSDRTVNDDADVVPNLTSVAEARPVPTTVSAV